MAAHERGHDGVRAPCWSSWCAGYACRALCPRGVRPFFVYLQCDFSSMGATALAARLGPLRRCSSP
eukprot:1154093-Prymnesium_polylepis.1